MFPARISFLLAILSLAGCLGGDASNLLQSGSASLQSLAFTKFDTGITCESFCEPVVVTDGETLYVKGDTLARGTFDGFEAFLPPAPPVQLGPDVFQADRHLDVDPEGRLWFSALVGQAGLVYQGVQVARSDDGGSTWGVDRYLGLPSVTPGDTVGADRQWLAFGPDGTAWLTFQRNAPASLPAVSNLDRGNVWIASSSDDGETWTLFEALDNDAGTEHATGRMAFDGDVPLVPVNKWDGTSGLYVFSPSKEPQRVADVGDFFPALAPYGVGFLIASMDSGGTLQVMTWDGRTATPLWSGASGTMISSPWLGVQNATYDVVWLQRTLGTESRFDVLWSRNGSAPHVVDTGLFGSGGVRANTDFAFFTYYQGRVLVVAGDNISNKLWLYLEAA